MMNRRTFLERSGFGAGLGFLGLTGCAQKGRVRAAAPALPFYDAVPPLAPIRVHQDRVFRITVCLRPFRAEGPRLEAVKVGEKLVIHNYGHGGSGWSLSWGSSKIAVEKALGGSGGDKDIAVIGCGALGLTSAILLQRAGARVTIYAKDRAPDVRSSRATGSWTPDSRIALTASCGPLFGALWEQMARTSYSMYQSFLGTAGDPVEWTDRYTLEDAAPGDVQEARTEPDPLEFARFSSRIRDITPRSIELPPGSHPFPVKYARRNSSLTFNIASYSRTLMTDFLTAGGKTEMVEFHSRADLSSLPQKIIINCPGYGARALWQDESVIPVRGQIAWLIPQPEVNYGLSFGNLFVLGRRDGIVVQANEKGEATGWKDENETADRGEATRAIQTLADLYSRMRPKRVAKNA